MGAADLGHYATVADVLVRYEFGFIDHHWAWLAAQAHGDWLFELDGDEMPSAALIAALRELAADRRVRQYVLPVHWPWPDPSRQLAEEPWRSDHRLRLLRNDCRLTFAGRIHAHAEPDSPLRYIGELPVYHLDLLLPDRARREAKIAYYDSQLFGLLTPEGLPFNEAYYLPESGGGGRATIALPVEDAEAITRSLQAQYDPKCVLDPATVPLHGRVKVDWYSPRADLPADAYRATLAFARPLPSFTAERRDHTVWIDVTNDGTARWPGGDNRRPLIRIGIAWQPVDGGPRYEAGRAFLPHTLDPGERTLVPVVVCGPPSPGPAELVLDLVHEHVRWFDCTVTARVAVGTSAAERLAALLRTHGPLLPLASVMQERREVGGLNGLLREPALAVAPTDRRIAKLTQSLDMGERAADADTIDRLVELVRSERPTAVVEFGSGTSTVVLAALMAKLRHSESRVIAFEHDPDWIGRTRDALTRHGLDRVVTLVHLPLGESEEGMPSCYVVTDEAAELLRRHSPELILVGGPALDSGASRLGTVDLVAPFLHCDVKLILDDALHDAGLCVGQAWERRHDIVIHGIRPTAKGLLEATLLVGSAGHA